MNQPIFCLTNLFALINLGDYVEIHLPGHNYTGVGTRTYERLANNDQPFNRIDEGSITHDLIYLEAQGHYNRTEIVNQADRIHAFQSLSVALSIRATPRERIDGIIVAGALYTQATIRKLTGGADLQKLMGNA